MSERFYYVGASKRTKNYRVFRRLVRDPQDLPKASQFSYINGPFATKREAERVRRQYQGRLEHARRWTGRGKPR